MDLTLHRDAHARGQGALRGTVNVFKQAFFVAKTASVATAGTMMDL